MWWARSTSSLLNEKEGDGVGGSGERWSSRGILNHREGRTAVAIPVAHPFPPFLFLFSIFRALGEIEVADSVCLPSHFPSKLLLALGAAVTTAFSLIYTLFSRLLCYLSKLSRPFIFISRQLFRYQSLTEMKISYYVYSRLCVLFSSHLLHSIYSFVNPPIYFVVIHGKFLKLSLPFLNACIESRKNKISFNKAIVNLIYIWIRGDYYGIWEIHFYHLIKNNCRHIYFHLITQKILRNVDNLNDIVYFRNIYAIRMEVETKSLLQIMKIFKT